MAIILHAVTTEGYIRDGHLPVFVFLGTVFYEKRKLCYSRYEKEVKMVQ